MKSVKSKFFTLISLLFLSFLALAATAKATETSCKETGGTWERGSSFSYCDGSGVGINCLGPGGSTASCPFICKCPSGKCLDKTTEKCIDVPTTDEQKCTQSGGSWQRLCVQSFCDGSGFGTTEETCPWGCYCGTNKCLNKDTKRCTVDDTAYSKCLNSGGAWRQFSNSGCHFDQEVCGGAGSCITLWDPIMACDCPNNKCLNIDSGRCVNETGTCEVGMLTPYISSETDSSNANKCFSRSTMENFCKESGGEWKTIGGMGIIPSLPSESNARSCRNLNLDIVFKEILPDTTCPAGAICDPAAKGHYCNCPSDKCVNPETAQCYALNSNINSNGNTNTNANSNTNVNSNVNINANANSNCNPVGISSQANDCNKTACEGSGGTWKIGSKSISYCDGTGLGINYAGDVFNCFCSNNSCLEKDGRCRGNANTNISISPCETYKGEVTTSAIKEDGTVNSSLCTEYTIKVQNLNQVIGETQHEGLIESGRDIRNLTKKEVSADSSANLSDCAKRAQEVGTSISGNTFATENLTEMIRESFSTISFKYASSIRYYTKKGHTPDKTSESYYFNDSYPYIDYLPGSTFSEYTYGKSYSGNYICRIYLDRASNSVTGYEIRNRPTGTAGETDWASATQTITRCANTGAGTRYTCDHKNIYSYNLTYQVGQNQAWNSVCASKAHKCEEVKLVFEPKAEWFATLSRTAASSKITPLYDDLISPPTPFTACNDQATCINQTAESQLTSETWGKGVQQVPGNFIDTTQKSLTSSNSLVKCNGGICVFYGSGSLPITAQIPGSSYYGQCRGYGITLNPNAVGIPALTANSMIDIQNRAPVTTVGLSKTALKPNEEVEVTCKAIDPDDCVDKISKVKWQCFDSKNNATICYFDDGSGYKEEVVQNIVEGSQTNPYETKIKFKASQNGSYAVVCEAWDNDPLNPLSGIGINGVSVSSDGGIIPTDTRFCAITMDSENTAGRTACGKSGKFKFRAYPVGIEPDEYRWKCASGSSAESSVSSTKECNYSETGKYVPSLTIIDKSGKSYECVSRVDVTVTDESKCKLTARKAGTADEFNSSLKVNLGDEVEAKVDLQCLEGGKLDWFLVNGALTSSSGNTGKVKFNKAGAGEIKAVITKDAKSYECGKIDVEVKDTGGWGL